MDTKIQLLEEVTVLFSTASTLEEFAKAFDVFVENYGNVERTGLYLIDPHTGSLRLLHSKLFSESERLEAERTAWERHPGWVIKNKKELIIDDESDESYLSLTNGRSFKVNSRVYYPLLHENECFGCVGYVSEHPNFYNKEFREITSFLTKIMALNCHRFTLNVREKNTAKRLREYSSTLEALLLNLNSGVLVENEERRIIAVNQAFCDLFSIPVSPESLIGTDCSNSAEESKSLFLEPDKFVSEIVDLVEKRELKKNEELHLIDGRTFERDYIPIFVQSEYKGHLWAYRDITSRKEADRQLRESEFKYRQIIENASDIIYNATIKGDFTFVNPKGEQLSEYSLNELLKMNYLQLVHPDEKPRVRDHYLKQILNQIENTYLEFRMTTKSGKTLWVGQNVRLNIASGKLLGLHAVARDITESKSLNAEIDRLKQFYEKILNDLPGQIAVFDKNLRYIFLNPESLKNEELRKYIIGKTDSEYFEYRGYDPKSAEKREETLREVIQTKKTLHFEEETGSRENRKKILRVINPILNAEGEVDYLIGYGLDITDLRAANESLERSRRLFQTVLETVADGIILLDSHSRIMLINEEVRRIWGYSKEALIREDFQMLFKEGMFDLSIWTGDVDSMYREISGQNIELTGIRRDGSTFPVEIHVSRMEFNMEVYYTVALSDITERRRRLKELEVARNIAIESTKAKEQFLAHISHEIRTPMNAVLGFTHLLLELNPSEEQIQFLKAIKYSTDNLLVIINDILDFSKIEANKLEFLIDDFSVFESVNHVIESVRYAAEEKGIKISATISDEVPFWVRGDQVRFGQILLNLVSNSVKFTEKGEVSVGVELIAEDSEEIRLKIKVTDTGIGIPKQYLNKIFDSFEQVKNRDRRAKMGTGLGLAIVKSLVEKQGGQIYVTSTEGVGSEFVVKMPFRISERDDLILGSDLIEEAKHTHKDLRGLNVLVVEDNEMNQLVATNILKLWGCTYKVAPNGKQALELYKNEDFDIILMDLSMPVMNGFETSEAIRLDFPFPKKDIPILAFTASAMIESKDRVYSSGMNDYISKPVKPVELQKKIFTLVGRDSLIPEKKVSTEQPEEAAEPVEGVEPVESKFKYIRLDYLNELTGGDDDIMGEMMNLFSENTPEVLARLRSLYNSKDWEEIKKVAHKFKPTLSYMGIKELEGVVPQIEKLALDSDPEGKIPALLDTLDFYSNEALKEIRENQIGK